MPRFGGFATGTGNFGQALAANALGTLASSIFPRLPFQGFGGQGGGVNVAKQQNATDRRVSLRPKPGSVSRVIGNGLLKPLADTGNRMIWPYTPAIQYAQPIDYQPIQTVHTNQDFHIYSKTPAPQLTVDGTFTVQNQVEGQYAMACIHFLRTMSKMNFGSSDPNAGTPPPVLLLDAYGPFVFKDIPVVVSNYSVTFPEDVDYVPVTVVGAASTPAAAPAFVPVPLPAQRARAAQGALDEDMMLNVNPPTPQAQAQAQAQARPQAAPAQTKQNSYQVWLPSIFKISVQMWPQHTPETLRKKFNLPRYRDGDASQQSFI